jgi:molecular chaperone GrpE
MEPAPELDATAELEPGAQASAGGDSADARQVQVKIAELNDRYLRLAADFDNYRKRMLKERAEVQAAAGESLVVELLPVLDNLERAIAATKASKDGGGLEGMVKGVELTLKMFHGLLGRRGVEKIHAVGEPFDPYRHEAVMQAESGDVTVDTVQEEMEPGYVMGGKVVRPARVKVAKPKALKEDSYA